MRVFKANDKVIVKTSDGGRFEGTVSLSTPDSIRLKKVVGDGKDFYKDLSFFSYEVVSVSSTKEGGDKQDRVVEGSSSGDEVDLFPSSAYEKVDASDGLVTSVAKDDKPTVVESKDYETETSCVNKRGKAPIAVLKTVPPHLRVFPFPGRRQEKLMLTAVAREEKGEDVELDMNLLSGIELQSFLEEVQGGGAEKSIPINFAMLTDLSSADAIVCFRHINSCSTVGISWEGVQSEATKKPSSVSLMCLTTSHLVCVLDIVAITNAAGGTLPEFLCDFLRNRYEERTFVAFDVRPLAHALFSNWNIELSSQTVDLQLFEFSLSALTTPTGRRSDGSSLMQTNSVYKMVLEEFNVERQPLYVRGKYRQDDMTLWMKRPISNVLLNAALFRACYLVPLFHRLTQRMLKPILQNSQKRWKSAMSNNSVSSCDMNLSSFVNVGNPLSFWRAPSPTDSAAPKELRRSCQEKLNQPKRSSFGEVNKVTQQSSLPNPSTNPPTVDGATPNIRSKTVRDDDDEQESFWDNTNLTDNIEAIFPSIRAPVTLKSGCDDEDKKSVPCTSVLFDRSEFFDTDIAIDSYNSCVANSDEDFGTIPSKPRQYNQHLSFAHASANKEEENTETSSRVCMNSSIVRGSNDGVDSRLNTSRSPSPPLLDRPVRSIGRGRGLKKLLILRPGFECF